MVFVNKCYEITLTRLHIGVLNGCVYIYGVCQQMLSIHFNSLTHRCIKIFCLYICLSTNQVTSTRLRIGVLKESVYIYGVCQQMLSSIFDSLTHRCIKRICLYIWCLSTNVIKSLQLAYT